MQRQAIRSTAVEGVDRDVNEENRPDDIISLHIPHIPTLLGRSARCRSSDVRRSKPGGKLSISRTSKMKSASVRREAGDVRIPRNQERHPLMPKRSYLEEAALPFVTEEATRTSRRGRRSTARKQSLTDAAADRRREACGQ